jgi:hypothetical protein
MEPTYSERELVNQISTSKTGVSFLSGALGGVVKCTCTLPLDVIKTTQQISSNTKRRSIWGQARYLYSTRGLFGFFVGFDVVLTQQVGKVGIQFASFQSWNSLVNQTFVAGALAGVTEACVWTTPSERIKIIQQAELASANQPRRFVGSATAVRYILKESGPAGLFRGVVPTAIRQASSLGVRFFTYSECKNFLYRKQGNQKKLWHAPLSGAICGITSATLNQPVDVIKTNMMSSQCKKESMIQTCNRIIQNDGMTSLYKGWQARSLKIAVGQAIVFGVYGNISDLLGASKV